LSTTLTARSIAHRGNLEAQIDYVSRFRADSIVKDAEAIRVALTADYPEDEKKWSIIGQSFGGFCSVTYLSKFPQGLREVFTLGGLPPLVKQPDVVYERLARRVAERSRQYYEKFPEDVKRVKEIAKYLEENDIKTMTGGRVSVDRLRSFGLFLGFHGRVDSVHYLFYRMWNDLEMFGYLSRPTISAFDSMGAFDDTIIYAILHEPIYCQGAASEWSADRLLSKKPEFEQKLMGDEPLLFTAEMVSLFQQVLT
jgi:pimeloyl-ACP methyl ester carboxylesterase